MELPGSVYDDGDHIKFEMDSGNMKVIMEKTNPGEHFDDLDLISKFMVNPTVNKPPRVGIQVMDTSDETPEGDTEYNWFSVPPEHNVPETAEENCENTTDIGIIKYSYGFAASKSGLFERNVCFYLVSFYENFSRMKLNWCWILKMPISFLLIKDTFCNERN